MWDNPFQQQGEQLAILERLKAEATDPDVVAVLESLLQAVGAGDSRFIIYEDGRINLVDNIIRSN